MNCKSVWWIYAARSLINHEALTHLIAFRDGLSNYRDYKSDKRSFGKTLPSPVEVREEHRRNISSFLGLSEILWQMARLLLNIDLKDR